METWEWITVAIVVGAALLLVLGLVTVARKRRRTAHLQDRFGSRALADRLTQVTVTEAIEPWQRRVIERAPFFWLATADEEGWPDVSYKGGRPGFVSGGPPTGAIAAGSASSTRSSVNSFCGWNQATAADAATTATAATPIILDRTRLGPSMVLLSQAVSSRRLSSLPGASLRGQAETASIVRRSQHEGCGRARSIRPP